MQVPSGHVTVTSCITKLKLEKPIFMLIMVNNDKGKMDIEMKVKISLIYLFTYLFPGKAR